jgi:WD40 repeat protein
MQAKMSETKKTLLEIHSTWTGTVNFEPNKCYSASIDMGSATMTATLQEISRLGIKTMQAFLEGDPSTLFEGEKIYHVSFSKDGRMLACGTEGEVLCLWEITPKGGKLKGQPSKGDASHVSDIQFSSDGKLLAVSYFYCGIQLFAITKNGLAPLGETIRAHPGWAKKVKFSPIDDTLLVSVGHGCAEDVCKDDCPGTIRLWKITPEGLKDKGKAFQKHVHDVDNVAFSPNGRYIASGSRDNTVRLWEITPDGLKEKARVHSGWSPPVAFSPNNEYLAIGSGYTIFLWQITADGSLKQIGMPLQGHSGDIRKITFSQNGKYLASRSSDGTWRLWDITDFKNSRLIRCVGKPPLYLKETTIDHVIDISSMNLRLLKQHGAVGEPASVTSHTASRILPKPTSRVKPTIEAIPEPTQLGWNCFDLAVDLDAHGGRQALVAYALEHTDDPKFRSLLAPEIKHAAALTAVYINSQQERDRESNQRIVELFQIADALENKLDRQQVETYAASLLKAQEGSLADLARNALPPCMHTAELQTLVNAYTNAHEEMREAVATCNSALGRAEGNILSLEQLDEFFTIPENVTQHQTAYDLYTQACQTILTPYEQALDQYCNRQYIYEQYVKEYYGRHNWFAFQQEFRGGHRPTCMVDIAARRLNAVIVIENTNHQEIYRTDNQGDREIHVTYNGHNHFPKGVVHEITEAPVSGVLTVQSAPHAAFFKAQAATDTTDSPTPQLLQEFQAQEQARFNPQSKPAMQFQPDPDEIPGPTYVLSSEDKREDGYESPNP